MAPPWVGRVLLATGGLLVLLWGVGNVSGLALTQHDKWRFERARSELGETAAPDAAATPSPEGLREPAPDQSDWSQARARAYSRARDEGAGGPVGLLEIPKIGLSVALREGTDAWTLNRAVGRIEGTAELDAPGNLGIAGHRDGFFRRLGKLAEGDLIQLTTLRDVYTYRVDETWIVDPTDVDVLDGDGAQSVLTLVTCYPFYYVGHAPRRYIVRSSLVSTAGATSRPLIQQVAIERNLP